MTAIANVHDMGGFSSSTRLLLNAATGDFSANGASVDCAPQGAQRLGSALVFLTASSTQGVGETCTITLTVQDADDDGTGAPGAFADVAADVLMGAADGADGLPPAPALTITDADADGNFQFTLPLTRLRRHVRVTTDVVQSNAANDANVCLCMTDGGNVLAPR